MDDNQIHLSICNERPDAAKDSQILKPWAGCVDDLAEYFGKAVIGDKLGPYFVRGPFSIPHRSDENITRADVLVIDGDKRIDPTTGELQEGAPAPNVAHEALQEMGLPHVIYTSHSHDPDRQHFRWRAIIPAPILTHDELLAMADHVVTEMQAHGCHVANVTENGKWSQPWFFPRIRSAEAPFEFHDGTDADPITRELIEQVTTKWKADRKATRPRERLSAGRSSPVDPSTPIGRYIATKGNPDSMIELLEQHGYILKAFDRVNEQPAYRLLAPTSTTDVPGVHLYAARDDGRWMIHSHHGEHDPLSREPCNDAFEVYSILEHGGDKQKAARAVEKSTNAASQSSREGYRLLTFDEFASGEPALEIVENLLPAEGTACIYGRSGTGKTFLTIDLMLAIARGLDDWFGYRVMKSPVVYLALEGAQGMRDRLEAYRMHAACSIPDAFRILNDRFSLASADDRAELIKAVSECGLVRPVVVIDTMTRATPGLDLNGPKDMGTVIAAVDDIQREMGGLVISVYHSTIKGHGGAEATEMGHSSLRGALDASIVVYEPLEAVEVKAWSTKKLKDAASGIEHRFSLESITVRHNQWGNPKTSCAVLPMVQPPFALQPVNEEMERRALADQLENYIVSGYHDGKRYTKRNLRDNPPQNMSKADVDKAFAILEPVGRVCDAPLPKDEWQGRRKSYIHPIKRIPIEPENKNPSGSIEETDQKMEAA